ncbi:1484_t:CDS:2 [Ambispora gerdemannii]|uniref:Very-long-chain 3-oxoacyl-CoA reductase n=1 Tax=Ambispora gerdemannii TaxID=144530 RepID=A0A9N9DIH7_9GLOM|nr:1484_t:CDS:2 [Ambispora gerdemannii]
MSVSEKVVLLFKDNDKAVIAAALFVLVGASVVTRKILSFIRLLFDVYIRPGKSLKKFGAGQGAWAIITGASDGIGKEFAYQLAQARFNLLLISRTQSKLQVLADEIGTKHNVETKIYAMDFSKGIPENLKEIIRQLDVGVLVNNVATNHEIPTPFLLETDQLIGNIVEVNIASVLMITKIVIPNMTAKNRGLILNCGSFSGYVPSPYLSVYSGSKAFLSTWSAALGMELKSSGITATAMSKVRRATWLIPYPKPYVKAVLSKIGVSGGASAIPFGSNPYPSHALVNWLISYTFDMHFWLRRNFAHQVDIRKRALRKREREAAAAKSQ